MDEFEVYLDFSLQAASFLEALISESDEAAQNEISPKSWVGGERRVMGANFAGIEISPAGVRKYPCPCART